MKITMTNSISEETLKDNVGLVYAVINDLKFIPENIEKEDLEQVGKIALWQALTTFKDGNGYGLTTHCYQCIKCDIMDYLRKTVRKKRKGKMCKVDDNPEIPAITIEEELMGNLLTHEIKRILPMPDVLIFVDKHLSGMTLNELAVKYNFTIKQVRYRLQKSIQILQEKLKWDEGD